MNLVITISLLSIGLSLIIGYAYGFRKGQEDGIKESTHKHGYIASRQRHEDIYGTLHSRS